MEGQPRRLRVMMVGLRGFPDVQGGVETHAENLCPRLVQRGIDMEVVVRAPYMRHLKDDSWHGVRFRRIWAPRSKNLETMVHTFLGVLYAGLKRPDVLHIQGIGPAIMTPIARLLGLKVVVTYHTQDYKREKWGSIAKAAFKIGEKMCVTMSNEVIVVSETIRKYLKEKYGLETTLISNGVDLPEHINSSDVLEQFDLQPGKYILMVSRLDPGKRHLDLIRAYSLAKPAGWNLVMVGDIDHRDKYSEEVRCMAQETEGVVMTGFQKGRALAELYSHAGIFVLPSSHEGLPIALLEALSYGLPVIASDIPANLELSLGEEHYFRLGNIEDLASRLKHWASCEWGTSDRDKVRAWIARRYNWDDVATRTHSIYKKITVSQ